MTTHSIRIATHGREYATSGAVSLRAANPMRAAALALLDQGRPPSDRLKGSFAEGSISPVSLAAIVRHSQHPRVDRRRSGSLNDAAMF
jgi:hypothetical protein